VKGIKEESGGKKVDQFKDIYICERTFVFYYLIIVGLEPVPWRF